MARFLSEDQLRLRSPRTALYVYVDNNPIFFIDPLGLFEANLLGGFGFSALFGSFGGEASAGGAITIKGTSLADLRITVKGFTSIGRPGGGVNFSGDAFLGFSVGELRGRTANLNLSGGQISVTGFFDPETGSITGGTLGVGPTLPCPPCIGVSGTVSDTETVNLIGEFRTIRPPTVNLSGEFLPIRPPKK